MQNKKRVVGFRNQRVVWTFIIFIIVFCMTTGILWMHVDNIFPPGIYRYLAKAGLFLVPAVTLMMTIWELFVDADEGDRKHPVHPTVKRFKSWCFYGAIILAMVEVLHSGGVMTYESSAAEGQRTIAAVGAAQAKVASAATESAINANNREADRLQRSGRPNAAGAIRRTNGNAAAQVQEAASKGILQIASASSPHTFLDNIFGSGYRKGGMYVALPLLAIAAFAITQIYARRAQPFVDADDDGNPDAEQKKQQQQGSKPPATAARQTQPSSASVRAPSVAAAMNAPKVTPRLRQ